MVSGVPSPDQPAAGEKTTCLIEKETTLIHRNAGHAVYWKGTGAGRVQRTQIGLDPEPINPELLNGFHLSNSQSSSAFSGLH